MGNLAQSNVINRDPARVARLQGAGQNRAAEFSVDQAVHRFEQIFEEMLESAVEAQGSM